MSNEDRIHKIIRDAISGSLTPASEAAREIVRDFVIIHKSDMPKAAHDDAGNIEIEGVDHSVWPISRATANRARLDALEYLAAAEAIVAALPSRRDELAAKFSSIPGATYGNCSQVTQKAIDYIIELESAA